MLQKNDVTKRVLDSNVENHNGFKILFDDFFNKLADEIPSEDENVIDDFLLRIRNYILSKLHFTIWHEERLSNAEDITFQNNVANL